MVPYRLVSHRYVVAGHQSVSLRSFAPDHEVQGDQSTAETVDHALEAAVPEGAVGGHIGFQPVPRNDRTRCRDECPRDRGLLDGQGNRGRWCTTSAESIHGSARSNRSIASASSGRGAGNSSRSNGAAIQVRPGRAAAAVARPRTRQGASIPLRARVDRVVDARSAIPPALGCGVPRHHLPRARAHAMSKLRVCGFREHFEMVKLSSPPPHSSGRGRMVNVTLPPPLRDRPIVTAPPWGSTIAFHTVSPSPDEPALEWNGSKSRAGAIHPKPGPSSSTGTPRRHRCVATPQPDRGARWSGSAGHAPCTTRSSPGISVDQRVPWEPENALTGSLAGPVSAFSGSRGTR